MSALNTSVVEMVKSIKKGEITSEELVKNYIKEIKKKEKDIQAWEFFDEELALAQEKKSDLLHQSGKHGDLHGIPIGIKDIFDTENMPTGHGTEIHKKNPSLSAQFFGFLGLFQDKKIIIKKVEPNSEADKKHIAPEDQITKINGKEINKPLNEILKECEKEVYVTIKKKFTEKEIKLTIGNYFSLKEIYSVKLKNTKQIRNFNFWIR